MADPTAVQSHLLGMRVPLVLLALGMVAPAVRALTEPAGADVAHPAIRATAVPPVLLGGAAAPVLFAARCVSLNPREALGARALWALGSVLLVLHIAVAFHLGHGWSHRAAWEHTRRVGGYGAGVFVNYAFALVWAADAAWAGLAFASYRARPRWLHSTVHAFLTFIALNATLVFGGPGVRLVTGVLVAVYLPLVVRWLSMGRTAETRAATDIDGN